MTHISHVHRPRYRFHISYCFRVIEDGIIPKNFWSGTYLYLPRLKEAAVLLGAVRDGCALLTWERDAFAYAESYDEAAQRYRGLRGGQHLAVMDGDVGLLVRPEVAHRQIDVETPTPPTAGQGTGTPAPLEP